MILRYYKKLLIFWNYFIIYQPDTNQKKVVTASLVVPVVVHLRDIKEYMIFGIKLVQQLQLSIEKRFAGISKLISQLNIKENDPSNDPVYLMAAVLDLSFKIFWLGDLKLPVNIENCLKQDVIQLILDKTNIYPNFSSTKLFDKSISSASKLKNIILFMVTIQMAVVMNPVAELEAYLNDPVKLNFYEYCSGVLK